MNYDDALEFLVGTYNLAFDRAPSEIETGRYMPQLQNNSISPSQLIHLCLKSQEYIAKRKITSIFPMGHYHSPVVDPASVGAYVKLQRSTSISDLSTITMDVDIMRQLWLSHLNFSKTHPFSRDPNATDRFRYGDGPFPEGDALALQLILAETRPKKVIEIGSGFSTACMLDSVDRLGLENFDLVCIEPDPRRLRSLLRDTDNITIIDKPVQSVDRSIVDTLEANDILFIDSTHVMKTGSDVHFEFFHLLPRLRPGVIVHFHDIFYPFEYPDKWIFDSNYSWNEAYVLRAFLMYNDAFEVIFWHSLLRRHFSAEMNAELRLESGNPGGSIWLRRQ